MAGMTRSEYWQMVAETVDDAEYGDGGEPVHDPDGSVAVAKDYARSLAGRFNLTPNDLWGWETINSILFHCGDHQAKYGEHGDNQEPHPRWGAHVVELARAAFVADVIEEAEQRLGRREAAAEDSWEVA